MKILLTICLNLSILTTVHAGQEVKIYLETHEYYSIDGDQLSPNTSSINGRIQYKFKKLGVKKKGDHNIKSIESSDEIRTIEILSENQIQIGHVSSGLSITVRANIERDVDGNLQSIKVNSSDYMVVLNPIHVEMDNSLLKKVESKILKLLPVEIRLKGSDLNCERVIVVDNSANEFSEQQEQLQCSQTHFVDLKS